jgi:hypothetical protein
MSMSHGDHLPLAPGDGIAIKTRDFAVAFEKKTITNRDRNQ